MCETCGCGQPDSFSIKVPQEESDHSSHKHHHKHHGDHSHEHSHGHSHDHSHDHEESKGKVIDVNKDLLHENNLIAERNRGFFEGKHIVCLNLVSSPGSGKTTILEKTIGALTGKISSFVIEGDQQSMIDAERIQKTGAPAIQINTGLGCHLDANMVNRALKNFEVTDHSIVFIENVGNLVCPALFDLGETKRVLIISVTEGDDKPLKYPNMFHSAHLCLINKTDLLPYVDFNVEKAIQNALRINPGLQFIQLSAKSGEGMEPWLEWCMNISH
jgi:hydrogenase nickel incorporation protein HypB